MNKQPQITAATRRNIAEAYWILYKTKKNSITVQRIMDKAGYNRGTFYEYFPNTRAVLDYIEEDLLEYIKESFVAALSLTTDVEIIVANATRIYEEKGEYLCVLLRKDGDPVFVDNLKAALKEILLKNLKVDTATPELDIIFEFMSSAMIGVLTYWYANRGTYDTEQTVRLVRRLMSEGALAQLQLYNKNRL